MFQAARWKAYLNSLQKDYGVSDAGCSDAVKSILHIYHSQKIWFTQDEDNGYSKSARASLEKCGALLDECAEMMDDLEETLANTPKPSTVLDWSRLW